jgi:tyrosyl-tRNA synthetase
MGCDLQIGGSDQWGNIISGVDLIRRKTGDTAYALTIPLVIDKATGKKFGKSEGNAVWLDAEKTSPFQFYQFWFNAGDEGVEDYLKLYTELTLDAIKEIMKAHAENPGDRGAQRSLAFAATELVHGAAAARQAEDTAKILFGNGDVSSIEDPTSFTRDVPSTTVAVGDLIIDVLVSSGLASSKREARQFVESGAVSMNNAERITDVKRALTGDDFFKNGLATLKRGKQNIRVLVKG